MGLGIRVSITSTFEIACAHQLPYHRGKCRRLHGHNYRLEFTRYGEVKAVQTDEVACGQAVALPTQDGDTGMVQDFGDFDGAIKAVLGLIDDDALDHRSLNDFLPNPTAENLVVWLLERLPGVDRVVAWETGKHCATAERDRTDAPFFAALEQQFKVYQAGRKRGASRGAAQPEALTEALP